MCYLVSTGWTAVQKAPIGGRTSKTLTCVILEATEYTKICVKSLGELAPEVLTVRDLDRGMCQGLRCRETVMRDAYIVKRTQDFDDGLDAEGGLASSDLMIELEGLQADGKPRLCWRGTEKTLTNQSNVGGNIVRLRYLARSDGICACEWLQS